MATTTMSMSMSMVAVDEYNANPPRSIICIFKK